MSEAINFNDLANVKAADVTPPPRIPDGHYVCTIVGMWSERSAQTGNKAFRYPMKISEACSDVDEGELEEAGGIPDKKYNLDFWMSPDARFIFTNFCEALGLDMEQNLMELSEELANCGTPFVAEIKSEQSDDDPDRWFTNIGRVMAQDAYDG